MDSLSDYANKSLKPMEGGPEMVVHYTDANGKSRIKGGSGLKSSQAYPKLLLVSNTHTIQLWYVFLTIMLVH